MNVLVFLPDGFTLFFSHPNVSGTYETREALSYQRFLLNAQKKVSNIRPSILRSFMGNYVNEEVSVFLNVLT